MTETEDQIDLSTTVTRDVHHIPLHASLNARVAYCGERAHGRVPFYGWPWKPICQTCEMLWTLDGKPGRKAP